MLDVVPVRGTAPLALQKVRDYTFAKHHLLPGYQSESIADVARNLVGLHSARLSSPYVALYPRMVHFQTKDLYDASFVTRTVVRLRCMRKTLHTVPLDLAPIVHQATLSFRVADCLRVYRQLDIASSLLDKLREAVMEMVHVAPSSSQQIQAQLHHTMRHEQGLSSNEDGCKKVLRTVIKQLWEEGTLCYVNVSDHWGEEDRVYGATSVLYPSLDFAALLSHEAQQQLIYYHIDRFGPVTESDICWWSGLSREAVRQSLATLQPHLRQVAVEGFDAVFYMTMIDREYLHAFVSPQARWVRLLAYEDPSLKGYFQSRLRYVKSEHYDALFNQIGEARASIVLNGEVIGVWVWDKKERHVRWQTFIPLDDDVLKELRMLCDQLEVCLNQGMVQHSLL